MAQRTLIIMISRFTYFGKKKKKNFVAKLRGVKLPL